MRTKLLRRAKKKVKLYKYKGDYYIYVNDDYKESSKYKSNAMESYRWYIVNEAKKIVSYNYIEKKGLKE